MQVNYSGWRQSAVVIVDGEKGLREEPPYHSGSMLLPPLEIAKVAFA